MIYINGVPQVGDMLKSVYDTDKDDTVDDSEELEGSTKAQVQDHTPKAHEASHVSGGSDDIDAALNPAAVALTTRGDVLFHDASGLQRLAKGTDGHVLTMGADEPAWAAGAGAGIWEEIGDHAVSGAEASISFASIPSGYAALQLIWSSLGGDDAASKAMLVTFNDDTTVTNYNYLISGGAYTDDAILPMLYIGHETIHYQISGCLIIHNVAGNIAVMHGTFEASQGSGQQVYIEYVAQNWETTDEITKVTLTPTGGNFNAGRVILLGLKT